MTLPSIPQLPTDNLYKFVALSGVLLMLAGLIVPTVAQYRMGSTLRLLDHQNRISHEITERTDAASKAAREASKNIKTREQAESVLAMERRVSKMIDSSNAQIGAAKDIIAEAQDYKDYLDLLLLVGALSFVLGGLLAWWGFSCWYERLQKPLDAWVKKHGGSAIASDR